jgi:acetylornithine deacetylase/succinyl-diaminopimelate desuccinylase-like protein
VRSITLAFAPFRPARRSIVALITAIASSGVVATTARAQSAPSAALRDQVRAYRMSHDAAIMNELATFLAIPNLASDTRNIRKNAEHLVSLLKARDLAPRLLEVPGSPPAVYAEWLTPGATKTIVFYAHYDGQPVDTTQWKTPPWQVVLRDKPVDAGGQIIPIPTTSGSMNGEWRLYARASSDDKSPIIAYLAAIDALRAAKVKPSVNLKFFFDGEEEAGSPHLHEILTKNIDLLKADAWLFGDSPVHQSRRQLIIFGVRGVGQVDVTLYGPSHALHDGHYGNWAPNPIAELANLVASMRNDDGKILIQHFYDDVSPITPTERKALARAPSIDSAMRVETQLGGTEAHGAPLVERIMLPALNVRGIRGGNVGALASNSIPTEATASIDFRLVPKQTPEHIRQLVEAHMRARGYFIVDHTPTPAERMAHAKIAKLTWDAGYPATRVTMDAPLSRALMRSVEETAGAPIVTLPTMGGSLPLFDFEQVLHKPLIVLPMVNHDNNQHASNENLRLQNLFDGIEMYAGVMAQLGAYWTDPKA